jgi:4-hydroxy-3-polyprenylbenzoate decarboxylase
MGDSADPPDAQTVDPELAEDVNGAIQTDPPRIVVGISGASGVIHGARVLDALAELGVESHLVVTRAALLTLSQETDLSPDGLSAKATVVHKLTDVGASIASGSFRTLGMIIAPCSVRTMGEIATGVTSSLLTRAADVTLKERRPLVLMVRETPLHLGHLRTMTALAEMGAIIAPPLPAFYARPESIAEMVDQSVGRALDLFGLDWATVRRWDGLKGPTPA